MFGRRQHERRPEVRLCIRLPPRAVRLCRSMTDPRVGAVECQSVKTTDVAAYAATTPARDERMQTARHGGAPMAGRLCCKSTHFDQGQTRRRSRRRNADHALGCYTPLGRNGHAIERRQMGAALTFCKIPAACREALQWRANADRAAFVCSSEDRHVERRASQCPAGTGETGARLSGNRSGAA